MSAIQAMTPAAIHPSEGYDGFVGWVLGLIEVLGEVGVGLAVLIETFVPPIPSEAILPVAGFLAYEGRMNAWGAWAAATIGALVGVLIWYAIGAALGRNRTRRLVGRIPLLDHADFDKAEAFFQRWGGTAVLLGRCVPLVRSFISIPAGIERMPVWRFSLYTVIGSGAWNAIWVGLGFAFGPAIRPVLEEWSGLISYAAIGIIALLVLWFVITRVIRRVRAA
ncbi:DedA family protein [Clavibacter sepedonicus]|uniref:Integral membrane protein n=1 Tax=Clavibacter sepedonicus TaxID=31964 RepID=B0RIT7_CLASE|nr:MULTISPECIES: DedA family protein [Clavibacter]MBD5382397.1 DedA family protein [Clavibacter sp.]OQJ48270.1 DedA family protein [Clavibacter sepedonicus]OQJ54482.1 DedA family protein [Clavibacter sepedonicus]UUK66050.1 DedA family protein [Clavibacter sepedonicus]CAQ02722.1 putative integral membrane protein [Clavibacter sepedonicus]